MSLGRLRRTAVLLLAGLVLAPSAARAHGGYQIAAGMDGPYGLVVRARPFTKGGRPYVDLTSYVVAQKIGEPDLSAAVTIHLTGDGVDRTVHPKVIGDGYEWIFPVSTPDEWRYWQIHGTVTGSEGTAHITGGPLGAPPGAPHWLPFAGAATVLALLALTWAARRRNHPAADNEDPADW